MMKMAFEPAIFLKAVPRRSSCCDATRPILEYVPRPPKRPRRVAHRVSEAAAAVRGSSRLAGGPARVYGRHGPKEALFQLRAAPRIGCAFSRHGTIQL